MQSKYSAAKSGAQKYVGYGHLILMAACATVYWSPVWADVHKCNKNGQIIYQQSPCENSTMEEKVNLNPSQAMLGCYLVEGAGYRSPNSRIKIDVNHSGDYLVKDLDAKANNEIRIAKSKYRLVTADELGMVSQELDMMLINGITDAVISSPTYNRGRTYERNIPGYFKGKNKDGKEVYISYTYNKMVVMEKISCKTLR